MATEIQPQLDGSRCFTCLGVRLVDSFELFLWSEIERQNMAATPVNTLLDEAKCYLCVGLDISTARALKLALLARTLKALVPTADTSFAALLAYAKCYACYGASIYDLLELALLDQISQNI